MHILVCGGTGCTASSSHEVIAELNKELEAHNLTEALKKDFEGFDELYNDFKNYHKFGNDIDDVDEHSRSFDMAQKFSA